jgi:hypothetical protein
VSYWYGIDLQELFPKLHVILDDVEALYVRLIRVSTVHTKHTCWDLQFPRTETKS